MLTRPFTNVTSVAGESPLTLLAYTNSAVTSAMKTNENVNTEIIHMRSRRALHAALRRSAAEAAATTGSRRLASNRIINAASAKIVTKKNQSLLTIRSEER